MLTRTCIAAALISTALIGGQTPRASAVSDEAVNACGASVVDSETAYVPSGVQSSQFISFATTRGNVRVNCGNGRGWGAVHIEVKHEVPNWAEASSCIAKTISRGKPDDSDNNKTVYNATINGVAMVAVLGNNGLITAYPRGTSGIEAKWSTCGG